ncbi:TlpA family protein disulfide reductase [Tamlana fucoidanivorans]|uniref:TlpA family protein disulfide reductase n=1 Tax=Allotamlana fucoidanivorans TaxID=2583814 RepID=A0A5C4SG68_9FLAO|nr:TlpA disulfide reductase family protein [Tamlana fucoidanivorans]TNJ42574.1 TlpA family protein disulfide reductase [Tamlana fucoidanivorans]
MKNNVVALVMAFLSTCLFAQQKSIDNPECGLNGIPGTITKIELNDSNTVLHFHIKVKPGIWISVPKKSFIQDVNNGEKLFVTKAEGIEIGVKHTMDESGEVTYALYFPKLDESVKQIDFGEANEGGNWFVYNIILQEDENANSLPKELIGNWFLADGSNRWDFAFQRENALVDAAVWNYKSVTQKGKKYTILLEREGQLKTIYAKKSKNGHVAFGSSSKALNTYSLSKSVNPEYSFVNNKAFETVTFGTDSTTYAGAIKGYTEKLGQKTAMVHVNNLFKGDQESYLIKINEDGSFKVKFPLTHPQTVYVPMFSGTYTVFLEPNTETFHYVNGKNSLFMGDNARVNTDLEALKDIRLSLDIDVRKKIGTLSPEAYKIICNGLYDAATKKLSDSQRQHSLSKKAVQIKNIELELEHYNQLLGYGMYRRSLQYQNKKAKKEEDKMPFEEFEVSNDYYGFLPKTIADNTLLTLSNNYYFFTNRLIYSDLFRSGSMSSLDLSKVEIAEFFQELDIELSVEELNMVEFSKTIETPEILAKVRAYREIYGEIEQGFFKNYKEHFKDMGDFLKALDNPNEPFIVKAASYLKTKDIEITQDEAAMVSALRTLKTPEEREEERLFNEQFANELKLFREKYSANSSDIFRERSMRITEEKLQDYFETKQSFLQDVVQMQAFYRNFEDYKVFSDKTLNRIQKGIHTPFIKTYLARLNEQTKQAIAVNKTKGGYTVHNVERTEGDELFDAMLEKFKGKVVYVDFWATWCGPCKSGIKRVAPLKEMMKDEDVVFLYITNPSSPEGTWKNAIANIKGEHYRVSNDEWNYLKQKFNIRGIPHYTLVDKKGAIVKSKMRPRSNETLRRILKEELEK